MGGNQRIYGITGVVIAILSITMFTPVVSTLVLNWSDNFNDGDYSGWTVIDGTFSAGNLVLCANGSDEYQSIQHPSSVAYGEWNFDLFFNSSAAGTGEPSLFSFIADELIEGPVIHLGMRVPRNGYSFEIEHLDYRGQVFTWFKWTDGEFSAYRDFEQPPTYGWNNITIHRNETGVFKIYHNGTLLFERGDNTYTTSSVFGWSSKPGHAVDNIMVYELEPTTTTTTPTTPTTPTTQTTFPIDPLLIGVGATIAVVVIVVVVYAKRKT